MPTINGRNGPISYEVREYLGCIPSGTDAWDKQLNLISWNGKEPPKYDIRGWSSDGKRMTKGITLYENEMRDIVSLYLQYQDQRKNGIAGKEARLKAREEDLRRKEARMAAIERQHMQEKAAGEAGGDAGGDEPHAFPDGFEPSNHANRDTGETGRESAEDAGYEDVEYTSYETTESASKVAEEAASFGDDAEHNTSDGFSEHTASDEDASPDDFEEHAAIDEDTPF